MEKIFDANETYNFDDYSLLFNESTISVEALDCFLRFYNKTYSEEASTLALTISLTLSEKDPPSSIIHQPSMAPANLSLPITSGFPRQVFPHAFPQYSLDFPYLAMLGPQLCLPDVPISVRTPFLAASPLHISTFCAGLAPSSELGLPTLA
ncbi:hypothetical protein NPIL_490471 [Nephila pilipes]|uniref:Uncharacterized protein n=1 Tax=Nephila pilipes TaxID=299642 RepID=A0A8X6IV38_NEPPI|nr:hypothetical protein NPIL_490471 [Nephila pilipes]